MLYIKYKKEENNMAANVEWMFSGKKDDSSE